MHYASLVITDPEFKKKIKKSVLKKIEQNNATTTKK